MAVDILIESLTALLIHCIVAEAEHIDDNIETERKSIVQQLADITSIDRAYVEAVRKVNIVTPQADAIKIKLMDDSLINTLTTYLQRSNTQADIINEITKNIVAVIGNDVMTSDINLIITKITSNIFKQIMENPKLSPYIIMKSVETQNNELQKVIGDSFETLKHIITDTSQRHNHEDEFVHNLDIYDKSKDEYHYCLFKHDAVFLYDMFIEPDYTITEYEDIEFNRSCDTDNFVSDCNNILLNQRILIVLGNYGSGKTIAMKYLQYILSSERKDVVFINCAELANLTNKHELASMVLRRKKAGEDLYLIFDAYDELNFISCNRVEITDTLLLNILSLLKHDGIYLILNTRCIFDKEEEVYSHLSLHICNETKYNTIKYVKLEQFTNHQIKKWLDNYSNEMAKNGKEQRLYDDDLKNLHKNLKNSCHNPLFLYMLVHCYYSKGISSLNDIHTVYSNFVESTISGKFSFEKRTGSEAIKEIQKDYRKFITLIAKVIANKHNLIIEQDQMYDWYLDSSSNQYGISHTDLSVHIKKIADKLINIEKQHKLDSDRLRTNILVCYFLEYYGGVWKFRDNNVLYYLLADSLYEKVKAILTYYHKGCSEDALIILFQSISKQFEDNLHPMSLDILFNRISLLTDADKQGIAYVIKLIIEKKFILQITDHFVGEVSKERLNINLLLCIIYLKLNREGYKELDYYFKRLNWYVSAAKMIDRNYLQLVRRFYKGTRIYNAEFRRINFDEYNFDYCDLVNVKYIQAKLYKTRMNFIQYEQTVFILCDINHVTMEEIKGNIVFENCIIDNVSINNPDNITIVFKRCYIKDLHMHANNANRTKSNTIIFTKSDMNNVILRKTKLQLLKIEECFHDTIKLEGTKANTMYINSTCRTDKIYQTDPQSEIREVRD